MHLPLWRTTGSPSLEDSSKLRQKYPEAQTFGRIRTIYTFIQHRVWLYTAPQQTYTSLVVFYPYVQKASSPYYLRLSTFLIALKTFTHAVTVHQCEQSIIGWRSCSVVLRAMHTYSRSNSVINISWSQIWFKYIASIILTKGNLLLYTAHVTFNI